MSLPPPPFTPGSEQYARPPEAGVPLYMPATTSVYYPPPGGDVQPQPIDRFPPQPVMGSQYPPSTGPMMMASRPPPGAAPPPGSGYAPVPTVYAQGFRPPPNVVVLPPGAYGSSYSSAHSDRERAAAAKRRERERLVPDGFGKKRRRVQGFLEAPRISRESDAPPGADPVRKAPAKSRWPHARPLWAARKFRRADLTDPATLQSRVVKPRGLAPPPAALVI
mmetsp:Transcript_132284/g.300624  ORF Transcript_132284/g.300624 Transcript_132284/m.300624 type:complete len:221 (+) Transcript_132284:23-685(+)